MRFHHGKEMDTVMTKTIMQDVNLMLETVAGQMSTRNFALNAIVKNDGGDLWRWCQQRLLHQFVSVIFKKEAITTYLS